MPGCASPAALRLFKHFYRFKKAELLREIAQSLNINNGLVNSVAGAIAGEFGAKRWKALGGVFADALGVQPFVDQFRNFHNLSFSAKFLSLAQFATMGPQVFNNALEAIQNNPNRGLFYLADRGARRLQAEAAEQQANLIRLDSLLDDIESNMQTLIDSGGAWFNGAGGLQEKFRLSTEDMQEIQKLLDEAFKTFDAGRIPQGEVFAEALSRLESIRANVIPLDTNPLVNELTASSVLFEILKDLREVRELIDELTDNVDYIAGNLPLMFDPDNLTISGSTATSQMAQQYSSLADESARLYGLFEAVSRAEGGSTYSEHATNIFTGIELLAGKLGKPVLSIGLFDEGGAFDDTTQTYLAAYQQMVDAINGVSTFNGQTISEKIGSIESIVAVAIGGSPVGVGDFANLISGLRQDNADFNTYLTSISGAVAPYLGVNVQQVDEIVQLVDLFKGMNLNKALRALESGSLFRAGGLFEEGIRGMDSIGQYAGVLRSFLAECKDISAKEEIEAKEAHAKLENQQRAQARLRGFDHDVFSEAEAEARLELKLLENEEQSLSSFTLPTAEDLL